MTLTQILAASLALSASMAAASGAPAASSDIAYPGGVGRTDSGPGPAGRSSFRAAARSPFAGATGGWGFAHQDGDGRGRHWDWHGRHLWRGHGPGFAYWDTAFAGDAFGPDYPAGYEPYGGPAPFGPQPPYGRSFEAGYPLAFPPASALAPSVYGPGPHDGAYAYGYNGYAQTPPLPMVYGPTGYPTRLCGC